MYRLPKINHPQDSDLVDRLRNMIDRLAAPKQELCAARNVAASDFNELLQHLVQEIDETVLPRRLGLFSSVQEVASLIVSNRRLLELEIDGQRVEATTSTGASPEANAIAWANALKALCARTGPLVIGMIGRAPQAVTGGGACSAQHLAEYADAPQPENGFRAFLRDLHPSTLGWILRTDDNDAIAHDPDKEAFRCLVALDQKIQSLGSTDSQSTRLEDREPHCTAFSISESVQAVIVSDGNSLLIAAVPHRDCISAIQRWSAIYERFNLNAPYLQAPKTGKISTEDPT